MTAIISGSSPSVTFSDGTTQTTSAVVGGDVPYALLPPGSVLQVVYATYGTQTTNNTSTFADTGLSATITPKYSTSKILALVSVGGVYKDTNNTYVKLQLLRNAIVVSNMEQWGAYTGNTAANGSSASSINFLDSPATTSAITYNVQFASGGNSQGAFVQTNSSSSTMVLMEIAG